MKAIILIFLAAINLQAGMELRDFNPLRIGMSYMHEMRAGMIATRQTMTHYGKKFVVHWDETIKEDFKKANFYSKEMKKQMRYGGTYKMKDFERREHDGIKDLHPYISRANDNEIFEKNLDKFNKPFKLNYVVKFQ